MKKTLLMIALVSVVNTYGAAGPVPTLDEELRYEQLMQHKRKNKPITPQDEQWLHKYSNQAHDYFPYEQLGVAPEQQAKYNELKALREANSRI